MSNENEGTAVSVYRLTEVSKTFHQGKRVIEAPSG